MKFYTIGVYGSTEKDYLDKLLGYKIDLFCDIRQRRGVRGKKYSFVNSIRLQNKLADVNIKYLHIKDLAPTSDIREKQKQDDLGNNILKRDRNTLGDKFVSEYNQMIIKTYDFDELIEYIKTNNLQNIVFFCVEEASVACHRSLVANKLFKDYNQTIIDL